MNFLDDGARLLHISIFIRPIYANITERGARPNLNMKTVELPPVQIILRQVLNAGITIEHSEMPNLLKIQRAEEQGNNIISQTRKAEIYLQKINGIDHIMVYDMPIIKHGFSPHIQLSNPTHRELSLCITIDRDSSLFRAHARGRGKRTPPEPRHAPLCARHPVGVRFLTRHSGRALEAPAGPPRAGGEWSTLPAPFGL